MSKNKKLTKSAGQPAQVDDIDLGAALPAAPAPKRPRGRPALPGGPAPKPRSSARKVRSDKGTKKPQTPPAPYIDINNILLNIGDDIDNSDKGEVQSATKLKDKMTLKELKFIGLYLSGEHTKDKAMILAGYDDISQTNRYLTAGRIIERYESQAGDHRIIARALGAGEVFVISGLMDLAKNGKSEIVKRAALGDLAKILGLTKEQLETAGGITIIFEGGDQPGPAALALPPGEGQPALPAPTRVLQITK